MMKLSQQLDASVGVVNGAAAAAVAVDCVPERRSYYQAEQR